MGKGLTGESLVEGYAVGGCPMALQQVFSYPHRTLPLGCHAIVSREVVWLSYIRLSRRSISYRLPYHCPAGNHDMEGYPMGG